MKNIRINRLHAENFKCHSMLDLNFGGDDRVIYGDNATGKTSIYDAMVWLLFGKDSAGNGEKNVDIKPLDGNGEVRDHQAITAVEAEFLADGDEIVLKRTLREVWSTRRGSSEMVYDGNTSDYFVNSVPCKKNAFDAAVRDLVDENLFRMLTSVSHFAAGMKWQERRAVLFDIAGNLPDEEIMAKDSRFADLSGSKGKLSVPEYKAKLIHQKKGLMGTRDDNPARISECQRTLESLKGLDFDGARDQEALLTHRRDRLSGDIISMEQDSAVQQKRLELRDAELRLEDMERRNRAHRQQQMAAAPDTAALERSAANEEQRIRRLQETIETSKRTLELFEHDIQKSREQWVAVNGEAFSGGACPTCGQKLPFEQLEKASRDFDEKKKQRLDRIAREAERLKQQQTQTHSRILEMEAEVRERAENTESVRRQIQEAKNHNVIVEDMPGFTAEREKLGSQIRSIKDQVDAMTADSGRVIRQKREELEDVNRKLNEVWQTLAKESYLKTTENRIAQLKEDMKNASEAIEAIDKMLFAIEEFVRFKCRFVEDRVNDYFRVVNFRLFREQANGGLEERCDPQYDGVPYLGLNNGMKVNAGIDIINTLSRHYGVTVPLFVDNAEAVTRLEECEAQVIRLVVSEKDKELRMV